MKIRANYIELFANSNGQTEFLEPLENMLIQRFYIFYNHKFQNR